MNRVVLSQNSLAILLLCTNLAIPYKSENAPKPFTPSEWEKLSSRLRNSQLAWPKAFFETSIGEWEAELGISRDQSDRIQALLARGGKLSLELERLASLGIWVTTRAEETYPQRLKKRLKQKSPIVLYGAGSPHLMNESQTVSIVGSRNVDEDGANFAEQLGSRCAKDGMIVVSGGSRGVDLCAQTGAFERGGRVISILSENLEATVRKKDVRNAILSGKMTIISAVHPQSKFHSGNAMGRNKYIYALGDISVVVASSLKGGTWSGANENLKFKWSPMFVRETGSIPEGNKRLLEMGGISLADEILRDQFTNLRDWFNDMKSENRGIYEEGTNFTGDKSLVRFVDDQNSQKVDLFGVVLPYIEASLNSALTEKELANRLNIYEKQLEIWLQRAVQMGVVVRQSSDRYIKKNPSLNEVPKKSIKQESLFE